MRLNASSTVISFLRSTNSGVIIEPAESSGYLSRALIDFLVSLSVFFKIRFTTVAGISSITSTASSRYSSSSTSLSSVSEKA